MYRWRSKRIGHQIWVVRMWDPMIRYGCSRSWWVVVAVMAGVVVVVGGGKQRRRLRWVLVLEGRNGLGLEEKSGRR